MPSDHTHPAHARQAPRIVADAPTVAPGLAGQEPDVLDDGGQAICREVAMQRVREGVRTLSLLTQAYVAAVSHRAGLATADVHAVGILRRAERQGIEASPGDLSDELALTPGAVTAMLDRMQGNRHLERRRSSRDARRRELHLTVEANQTSDDLFAPLLHAYDNALADMPPEHLELLARLLEALGTATRTATKTAGGDGWRAPRQPG